MEPQGLLLEPKRFAVHDGPGIRTTFFFKGCVLRCRWCHNPESISPIPQTGFYAHKCISCGECADICPEKAHTVAADGHTFKRNLCTACGKCEAPCLGKAMKLYGRKWTVQEAVALALEDEAFYRQSGGGVTLSGGEPLMQPEFAEKLMQELRLRGIHTALDTCACVREELFRRMLPCTDLFLVDFKHADSQRHQELTGAGNELVKSNLTMLSEAGAAIEIRIPLIPGCNDDEENLVRTGEFLSRLQLTGVRLLPYHPYSTGKYQALDMPYNMPDVEIPDEAKLEAAADILRQFGLNILK